MRQETQHWNKIKASLEVVVFGFGQTGLTPVVGIQRLTDGQWLANGGGSWGASFATNDLSAVDGTNLPGVYEYEVPLARLTYTQGLSGYRMVITESVNSVREDVAVVGARSELEASLSLSTATSGSAGEELAIINALRQNNLRVIYDDWDVNGKPIHGFVYVYGSKASLEADTDPWSGATHSWEIDAEYDGSGRITRYESTRET